ncbi:GNAT family N-acetyltransferase [Allomuricauda sp. SCSIO 65647]|uniref:GNAT family N-acetyltransferase n=1 Tax=Allomuricauda sp. SCSIO 65647 TaxID=2908843 RepID=UPI001F3B2F8A|nr:GNAT family N-acetyltransferase [Muricauda sp. SCSIO 65647]UJH68600.1 GNAT family N-acetyltransferase [Muricauda sp. SCSIO 65647]
MTLDFSANYVLQNARARLEPLQEKHIAELESIAKEMEIWTYFLGRSDGGKNFPHYIKDAILSRKNGKEYPFAVFDKQNGKYAGSTRFFEYAKDLETIRLGYSWYGIEFRGTKLNKNCKFLMFQFAFEKLGLERVGLGAHEENKISLSAMQSVGCKIEGRIRNAFPSITGHGRSDAVLLGVLKQEWFKGTGHQLKEKL